MRNLWLSLWLTTRVALVVAMNAKHWQRKPSYPPDKTSTWNYSIAMDGWTLAHDALRGEVNDFMRTLNVVHERRRPISKRQVRALRTWWRGHMKHMQSHHRNEDRIVKAFVEKRFDYPHFMEDDHAEIEHHFDVISKLMRQLSRDRCDHDRTETVTQLQRAFQQYADCLLCHLIAEEAIAIPLTRAYFTPTEVQRLTNHLARIGPRVETGAIVHYVGVSKLKRAMELQNAPLQRVVWPLILNPRYRYYKRHMLARLDFVLETPT